MPSASLEASLKALFDAERAVRAAHGALAEEDPRRVMPLLQRAVREAASLDEDEAALRLVRVATLAGEFDGPQAVDLLIDILGSDAAEARHEAGEELSAHAWERFKEVALGVERALDRLPGSSPALLELPYILAEIPEPGVLRLLGRFLKHENVEVVASTIEALVETGDPEAEPLLLPLVKDARKVQLEDEGGTEGEATIGELASEAIDILKGAGEAAP
jgi:HEAT repeat protein